MDLPRDELLARSRLTLNQHRRFRRRRQLDLTAQVAQTCRLADELVIAFGPFAELIDFLVPRMPRYWLPRFVELVPELPRTESYKVRKADLRAAGIGADSWDREQAAVRLEREVVR